MLPDIDKIKKESEELKSEIWEKTVGYIVAALSLVAGLAWSDTIKGIIEFFFPGGQRGLWLKVIYAVLITLMVIVVSFLLARTTKKKEKQ